MICIHIRVRKAPLMQAPTLLVVALVMGCSARPSPTEPSPVDLPPPASADDEPADPSAMPPPGESSTDEPCAKAGCSGIVCVEAERAKSIVTTCEYRPEYACYQAAACEPQANGECGWTQTPELAACLAHPPPP
jgi:eight-cysteine-cluster-containing protein